MPFRSLSRCLGLVLIFVLLACAAAAQDVVTVGTVTADGPTIDVPVYIRDVAGTPLGMDKPASSRIQAFSIRVNYSPASAVSSVSFSRAGITAGLTPVFETAPATSGSASLLASFQQSTNPIPFTLDAPAPGNLVAHLVFNLSASATAGSSIALTLDGATTQLTDEGGTAATKETDGNGLALVSGAINIPVPSLSISPPSQSINAGSTAFITLDTSERLVANTTVTLSSSNPAVATVPPSTTIPAGAHSVAVNVTAVAPGNATITATLAASAGGASKTATVIVNEAPVCTAPAVPQISAPSTALAGAGYSISWPAVSGANEYLVDEATDAAFATAVSRTVTTTSTSYSHATAGVTYFYRVRARNRAGQCDVSSSPSTAVSVLITVVVTPATRFLPVVGSTPGNFGSFFKTSLQLYNASGSAISGKIVFHTQGTSGSPSDPSLAYTIQPGRTLSFDDLLPAMGLGSGLGSADLIATATSPLPVALARVFNDGGAAGTTGFALDAATADEALKQGSTGVLFAPADVQRFRLNIGVRTLEQGATLNVTVRNKDGVIVKTLTKSLAATFFAQTSSAAFLDGFALTGGETLSFEVTGGSAFVYGATTDNTTNDPSVQFARRIGD